MAIRWNEYRKRRLLDIKVWADNLKLMTYEDISNYLWSVGVMPPEQDHKDVLLILSRVSGSSLEESHGMERDEVATKPSSGRREERHEKDQKAPALKSKPTSGRSKPEDLLESPESSQKKSKPSRKRRSPTRRSTTAKKSRAKKKSE